MKKIIAVASHKGGVGKTTTALNLGFSLKLLGKKVLVLDCDPQGGLAVACNLKARNMPGLVKVLRGEAKPEETLVYWQEGNFAVAGTGIDEPADIKYFEDEATKGTLTKLIRTLAESFDYVIIDAPVGMGAVVRGLLAASDSYIAVVNCLAYTVKSVSRFFHLSQWLRENVNAELQFDGALVTMFNSDRQSEQKIIDHLRTKLPADTFFKTVIPHNPAYEHASIRALPMALLAGRESDAKPYLDLARELMERTGIDVTAAIELDILEPVSDEDGGFSKDRSMEKVLSALCVKADYCGALVGDEMGFAIAQYKSPLAADVLAAFASELGEVFGKTAAILELQQANNISIEITDSEKLVLHRFMADERKYYLLVVCPHETEDRGELERAAARIIDILK